MNIHKKLETIKPYGALGMNITEEDKGSVEISIPLQDNYNDKKTMFAGSIYSAMVLCGWTSAYKLLNSGTVSYDVVIKHAEVDYKLPVKSDARAAAQNDRKAKKKANGNMSVNISVQLKDSENRICAVFSGEYIGIPKC